ncbi:MAG: amino acid permease [Gemmataceae bacterium]|nr:amino acid permease [Gemmataceae bacterium]
MSITATEPKSSGSGNLSSGFQQKLGLFDSTMLVVGTMIGSGIFVTSVGISRDVGAAGWLLAVWALAGVMTIIGALSYGELAAMMPHAGGQYVYLREAYSPLWGFLYGWTCFLVIQTGSIAAVAVVFAKYLGVFISEAGTENKLLARPIVLDWKLQLPGMDEPFWKMETFNVSAGQIVAVFVLMSLTLLNCRGIQEGKIVQNVFTVAKTLALILLIVIGLFVVASPTAWQMNFAEPWAGIEKTDQFDAVKGLGIASNSTALIALMVMGGAMVGALFSADAWNNITFTAGEMRNPRRTIPLALGIGTGSVILLYMLANLAYVSSLPIHAAPEVESKLTALEKRIEELQKAGNVTEANAVTEERLAFLSKTSTFDLGIDRARDERVGTAVMELWSPGLGAKLMALAIMVSTFGCVNGMILMGARLYYVMAKDNLFFQSVGTLNSRAVPAVGLILQGLWSVLLVFSGTYDDLLDFVIFAVLVFYVLTVAGLFVLRRTRPDAERPYKAFGYPVLPALYVLLCAVIMVNLLIVKPKYTWPGLIIVLTGVPVYFIWRATQGTGVRSQGSGASN